MLQIVTGSPRSTPQRTRLSRREALVSSVAVMHESSERYHNTKNEQTAGNTCTHGVLGRAMSQASMNIVVLTRTHTLVFHERCNSSPTQIRKFASCVQVFRAPRVGFRQGTIVSRYHAIHYHTTISRTLHSSRRAVLPLTYSVVV